MSEKIYTRLFRLYPSRFRKQYEGEALQLMRDRLRDETGFIKKARLLWDLAADVFAGLPQAYRNSYAATETVMLSPNIEGIPSFKILEDEPIARGSIFFWVTLSLATMVAFGFFLTWSISYLPVPAAQGRLSPIEAAMDRLNQPASQDTPARDSPSSAASERKSTPQAAAAPSAFDSTVLPESGDPARAQDKVVAIPTQKSDATSVHVAAQLPAGYAIVWRGILTDASGRPVGSAELHLIGGHGDRVVRTAADGSFTFDQVSSGDYELTVVQGGREVAYRKTLYLRATSSPTELILASGGRVLVSQSGKLP